MNSTKGLDTATELKELRSVLSRCVKCGRCRSVCPVFRDVQRETGVARGKVALLEAALEKRGRLPRGLASALSLCLLCGNCTVTCPNGARAHEAVQRARAIVAREGGLPPAKRALARWSAGSRKRRDPLMRGAALLQRVFMEPIPKDRGLRFRLPGGRSGPLWTPRLRPPFFLDRAWEGMPEGSVRGRIGLFVGCAIHYVAPEIGEASVGLLTRLGFRVMIPQGQGCCGLMAHGMGDESSARETAVRTLESFGDPTLEAIVAPCASCAAHLKKGYPFLLREGTREQRKAAEDFAGKIADLSEFLVRHGPAPLPGRGPDDRPCPVVTYHDPCHLRHGMGLREEPRRLLKGLETWSFREMEAAERCCGMGGSFRLSHPGVSRRILREKVRSIQASGAAAVVTGCMGCWIQLQEGLHKKEPQTRVLHLAEILWEELGRGEQSSRPKSTASFWKV